MLGKIVEIKLHRKRAGKPQPQNTSGKSNKNNGNDENDHKITEFFQVRRSSRRTAKEIEDLKMDRIYQLIKTGANEEFLEIYTCKVKGRGIRSSMEFQKGEFVVEYKGEIIKPKEAQIREEKYTKDETVGSYMYFFKHRDTEYCVDATQESPYKGRLINHSYLRPNLKTRVVDFGTSIHLILVAKRYIDVGEELLYDYGERRAHVIAENPWLLNS